MSREEKMMEKRAIFFCSFCAFATVFAFPSSSTISFLGCGNFKKIHGIDREGKNSREEKIAENEKREKNSPHNHFPALLNSPLQVKQRKLMNGGGLRMNRIFPKKKNSGEQFPMLFFFHFSAARETWWCSRTHLHSSIRPHSSPHIQFFRSFFSAQGRAYMLTHTEWILALFSVFFSSTSPLTLFEEDSLFFVVDDHQLFISVAVPSRWSFFIVNWLMTFNFLFTCRSLRL